MAGGQRRVVAGGEGHDLPLKVPVLISESKHDRLLQLAHQRVRGECNAQSLNNHRPGA
jgi:hypothetical protein